MRSSPPLPLPAAPSRPPPAAVPVAAAPQPLRKGLLQSWRTYSPGALPSMVGYGLLVLFALDIAQALIAYRPFRPEDDQALILQIIERIAVPLVAYVLVFWWEAPSASRFELRVRKLLSIGSLFAALACAVLAVMAVHSGLRLHGRANLAIELQERELTTNLQRLAKDLPTLPTAQVQLAYQELLRRGFGQMKPTALTPEDMRREIVAALPLAIEASHTASLQASAQARRLQLLMSGKYFLGALISGVLFFLIWDATASARAFAFFSRRGDSTLTATERMERAMDSLSFLPRLEDYHWYRLCRREWRLWCEKREARARTAATRRGR
jgi:hypothetical protein